jgi:hypothetical protein
MKKRKITTHIRDDYQFYKRFNFFARSSPSGRGSAAQGTRALDIRIEDRIPSAERMYNDVDVTLWGIVELIQKRADLACDQIEKSGLSESDATAMTALGLPLVLGKPVQNRKKKKKYHPKLDDNATNSKVQLPLPPKLTELSSESTLEKPPSAVDAFRNVNFGRYLRPMTHNAVMVQVCPSSDAPWLEGKILGVGPSSTIGQPTSLVAFLRRSPAGASGWSVVEVPRNDKHLRLVCDNGLDATKNSFAQLRFLIEREEYASFDRQSSASYYRHCSAYPPENELNRITKDSITQLGVHPKYWDQRFRLLSKWDRGCVLDAESWYSITPEPIACWLVQRCVTALRAFGPTCDKPLGNCFDMFSGCGGCTLQLARESRHVFAVDLDPTKAEMARHNTAIYYPGARSDQCKQSTAGNCTFITDDVYNVLNSLPDVPANAAEPAPDTCADLIVLSPPWGGPEYIESSIFDLSTLPSGSGVDLLILALRKSRHCCAVLPRTVTFKQLRRIIRAAYRARHKISLQEGGGDACEDVRTAGSEWLHDYLVEDVYLYGKCKVTVLYVGPGFRNLNEFAGDFLSKRKMQALSPKDASDGVIVGGSAALASGVSPSLHLRFED